MSRIYVYKITADDGIAPCPHGDALTLAVCKPAIRRTAQRDDYLIGIGSNDWYPRRLLYVARVEESIPGSRYYHRRGGYTIRPDCIYRWESNGSYRWVNHGGRRVHDPALMPKQTNRDVGYCRTRPNAVALWSRQFVYFGKDSANHSESLWRQFPEVLAVAWPLGQSHLVDHTPLLQQRLLIFCQFVLGHGWPGGPILDEPHHRPAVGLCHDDERETCGRCA